MKATATPLLDTLNGSSIAEFLNFWLSNRTLDEKDQQTFDHYYHSYKKRFGRYLRYYYERQTRELMELVKASVRPRVLEVGCGCGTEALWAAAHGATVTGVDISEDLLSVARHRLGWMERETGKRLRCQFLRASVLELGESDSFDIVYMEQAFHHIEPRERLVEKLSRLVRPGGHLIISEANGWNPFIQLSLFKMRGTKTILIHEDHQWGHERITVPWAMTRQFKRHRFVPVTLSYYRTLPNIGIADRLLFLDRRLPPLMRPLFTHFNLVLKKQH